MNAQQIEMPIPEQRPTRWPLWLVRQRDDRLFAEMEREMRAALQHAWPHSVHHSWLEDVVDFIDSGAASTPWSFISEGKHLSRRLTRLHREGHSLYTQEEEDVRRCAALLIQCGRALRQLAVVEGRVFSQAKQEVA